MTDFKVYCQDRVQSYTTSFLDSRRNVGSIRARDMTRLFELTETDDHAVCKHRAKAKVMEMVAVYIGSGSLMTSDEIEAACVKEEFLCWCHEESPGGCRDRETVARHTLEGR